MCSSYFHLETFRVDNLLSNNYKNSNNWQIAHRHHFGNQASYADALCPAKRVLGHFMFEKTRRKIDFVT